MKRINDKGITLMELIVTIAILAVVLGSVVLGVGILASGDAQKAAKTIRSTLNEVRTDTLSIQAEWQAKISNEGGKYKISVYRDGEETDCVELGSRIDISYGDGSVLIESGEELVINFKQSTGSVKGISAGSTGALSELQKVKEFEIAVSNSNDNYRLVLWWDTGKVTAGE